MDFEEPSIIPIPRDNETLTEYLRRYSRDEHLKTFLNPKTFMQVCTILVQTNWPNEPTEQNSERNLQKVWQILRRMDNYDILMYHIQMWEPTRLRLLDLMTKSGNYLNKTSKMCTIGRLMGCTMDSLSTLGGLYFSDSKYSSLALGAATSFGALALISTFSDMKISKDTYQDLKELIERDQYLFTPIQKCYQESEELEKAMKAVFPFDFTNSLVKKFIDIAEGKGDFDRVQVFSNLLEAVLRQDETQLQNKGLIWNLINLTNCKSFQELCEWFLFRKHHPIVLDITRMILQYNYSSLRYLFCQSLKALAPSDQHVYSIPVMGRICLNTISAIDAFCNLRKYEVPGVYDMLQLERHLRMELNALKRIVSLHNSTQNHYH